jgi:hypothetical protein
MNAFAVSAIPIVYRDVFGDALFHPQDGLEGKPIELIYYYSILIQKDFLKRIE